MSRHGYDVLPVDQQDTDLIPQVSATDTAAMPAVEVLEAAPAPLTRRHRAPRRGVSAHTVAGVLAGVLGVAMAAAAAWLVASRDVRTVREQVRPSAPVSSQSHPVIVAPPSSHTPRPARRTAPRRLVPAVPVPTPSRSSATPKQSVSATPKATPTHTATPAPTLTVPPPPVTETPAASEVTSTSRSKEMPPC